MEVGRFRLGLAIMAVGFVLGLVAAFLPEDGPASLTIGWVGLVLLVGGGIIAGRARSRILRGP